MDSIGPNQVGVGVGARYVPGYGITASVSSEVVRKYNRFHGFI